MYGIKMWNQQSISSTRASSLWILFLFGMSNGNITSAVRTKEKTKNIPALSEIGSKILSQARILEDYEYDHSWMEQYSIQFQSCHSILSFAGGEGEGGDAEE